MRKLKEYPRIIGFCLIATLCLVLHHAKADLRLGTGFSSSTGGRMVPALYAGLNIANFGISLASVGYQNQLSYHAAHQLNLFGVFRPGKILWGDMEGGIGLGFYHYQIGYKEDLSDTSGTRKSDIAVGPAVRVFWHWTSFTFLGLEAMYGIRNSLFLFLSSQDSVFAVVGVSI